MAKVITFVSRLHDLLNNKAISHDYIHFVNKTDFAVSTDQALAILGLNAKFQFRSLSSFIRQLSYYGFVRLSDRRRARLEGEPEDAFIIFTHPTGAFKRNDSSDLDQIVRKARTRVGARSKRPNRSKSSKLHKSSNSKSRKRRRQYASSSDESDQEDEEDGSEYSSDYDSGYASQKKKLKVEVKVKPGTMELDSQSEAEETPALRPKLSEVIRQQALKRMPTFAPLPISYAREFSSHPIPSTSTSTWTSPNLSSYKSIFESRNTQRQTFEHQASAQKHSKPYFYPNRIYKEQVHAHSEPTFTMKETSINSRYVITSPECSSPSPEYSSPSSSYSAWSQSPVNSRSSFSAYSDEESDLGVAPNSSTSHFENVGLGIDGLDATLFKGDTRDSPSRESSPGPFDLFDTFIV